MRNRHQPVALTLTRSVIGLVWIAGALFNALWTPRYSEVFQSLAAEASLPVYRWLFGEVVGAHPVVWAVLLVIGEFLLGVITLGKGRWGQLGLALGALWSILLFPLVWPYTLMMGPYAVLLAWLASRNHATSLLDLRRMAGGAPDQRVKEVSLLGAQRSTARERLRPAGRDAQGSVS
jgi:hypothetical protein